MATSLAATVTAKLKGTSAPTLDATTFKGSPAMFLDLVWDYATQEQYERGKPMLVFGGPDEATQGKDMKGISLFGTQRLPGQKRQSQQFEVRLIAKSNYVRANETPSSTMRLELARGTWDSPEGRVAKAQVTAILAHLRSGGWLAE